MPEGDTVHKLARYLRPALVGRTLRAGEVRGRPDVALAGRRVREVFARGKHLFCELDGDLVLRSHLGLHGSWHRYAVGEPWRVPERQASLVLATERDVYVCFHAKQVELLDARRGARDGRFADLGPDLVLGVPDAALVDRRVAAFADPDAPVVDVLLDQRVASGIGNVYKSEVLFLEGVHPLTRLRALGTEGLLRLYATAHRLLGRNLTGGPRVTRGRRDGAGDLWVYGRRGCPCFECGAPIEARRTGRGNRSTSWCPRCQPRPTAGD